MTGSSVGHLNLLSLAALVRSAFSVFRPITDSRYSCQSRSMRYSPPGFSQSGVLTSWTVLVLPILLSMTLFANLPLYLDGILLLANLLMFQFPRKASSIPFPSDTSTRPAAATSPSASAKLAPLPALTTYRAHMMLMTVLESLTSVCWELGPSSSLRVSFPRFRCSRILTI
jgi:phosphatidylinositol glycan class W